MNSSGRKTLKPMVTSASLERMHPSSTDRIGNLLSSVAAFNIFLMNAFFKKGRYTFAIDNIERVVLNCGQFHQAIGTILLVEVEYPED